MPDNLGTTLSSSLSATIRSTTVCAACLAWPCGRQERLPLIAQALGTRTVREIIAMDPMDLADLLESSEPLNGLKAYEYGEIATALTDRLTPLVRRDTPVPAAGAPTQAFPTELRLVGDTPLDQRSIARLFKDRKEGSGNRDAIEDALKNHPTLRRALQNLEGGPDLATARWVLVRDGEIDGELSDKYTTRMALPGAQYEDEVDGIRPVTLDAALMGNELLMLYPLATERQGALLRGPDYRDRYGNIWAGVPDHVSLGIGIALLTRQITINSDDDRERYHSYIFKPAHPAEGMTSSNAKVYDETRMPDWLRKYCRDLKAAGAALPMPPQRFPSILADAYVDAWLESLAEAGVIPASAASSTTASNLPFGDSSAPAHDESWYMAELYLMAADRIEIRDGTTTVQPRVVKELEVYGGLVTLPHTVVLEKLAIYGDAFVVGSAYVHEQFRPQGNTSCMSLNRQPKWSELYKEATRPARSS